MAIAADPRNASCVRSSDLPDLAAALNSAYLYRRLGEASRRAHILPTANNFAGRNRHPGVRARNTRRCPTAENAPHRRARTNRS